MAARKEARSSLLIPESSFLSVQPRLFEALPAAASGRESVSDCTLSPNLRLRSLSLEKP